MDPKHSAKCGQVSWATLHLSNRCAFVSAEALLLDALLLNASVRQSRRTRIGLALRWWRLQRTLTPQSIGKQVLLHEQKAQRNDSGIIQRADNGERIGYEIQRIQDIEQSKYGGAQGPAWHLAVRPVPRVANEMKQQPPVIEKAFQRTVTVEARLDRLGLSHNPFDVAIGYVRSACLE